MLRQAQQTCSRLKASPELVEGFQALNLIAKYTPPLLHHVKVGGVYFHSLLAI